MNTIKRQSNMDLMRILSMFLIILLHSIDHSGVLEYAYGCSAHMNLYVQFIYAATQVCVNLYVMLSGYFLVKSEFRLSKLVDLWMETVFYSFALKLLFMIFFDEPISWASLLSCFFPILTGRYWFVTIYVGLYILFPFLNILIRAMNKFQHTVLNVILFALFSLTISLHPSIAGMNSGGGWGIAWFVVLYFTAAWLRLYYTPHSKSLIFVGVWLAISVLMALSCTLANKMGIGIFQNIFANWYRYDSAPTYIMTICLFVGFLNVEIKSSILSKCIQFVSPLTFGVYLIHAHANVSPKLWELANLPSKMNNWRFVFIQFGVVMSIFVACAIIDFVRKFTIGRVENSSVVHRASATIMSAIESPLIRIFKGKD